MSLIRGVSKLGLIAKYSRAVSEFGVGGVLNHLYAYGDVKFGALKGQDKFGNKYYENLDYDVGQTRWIFPGDVHNFESSSVPAGWEAWISYQTDFTPEEQVILPPTSRTCWRSCDF